MFSAYEYVVGFIYGNEEEAEPEPVAQEETDSLDGSITEGIPTEAINPSMVIRKSTTDGFRPSHAFKAVPSMVIKAPEPDDNYDSSVIAVMLTPAGLILASFGSIMTLLAYTTLVGFESHQSVAEGIYGYPVRFLGPLLIICGVVTLLLAGVVFMCTPRQRDVPMLYPQLDEDAEVDNQLRVSSSRRRVSLAKVEPSPAPSASRDRRSIAPGSQMAMFRSATAVQVWCNMFLRPRSTYCSQ